MQPSARAPLDHQLAALEQRLSEVDGELAEQAEAMAARLERGKPMSARWLARHDRMRDTFWSLKRRCEQLRARGAESPAGDDDF